MTEEEIQRLIQDCAGSFIEAYGTIIVRLPKLFAIAGMTGALAACATEAGIGREKIITMISSAFNDIEGGDDER